MVLSVAKSIHFLLLYLPGSFFVGGGDRQTSSSLSRTPSPCCDAGTPSLLNRPAFPRKYLLPWGLSMACVWSCRFLHPLTLEAPSSSFSHRCAALIILRPYSSGTVVGVSNTTVACKRSQSLIRPNGKLLYSDIASIGLDL